MANAKSDSDICELKVSDDSKSDESAQPMTLQLQPECRTSPATDAIAPAYHIVVVWRNDARDGLCPNSVARMFFTGLQDYKKTEPKNRSKGGHLSGESMIIPLYALQCSKLRQCVVLLMDNIDPS